MNTKVVSPKAHGLIDYLLAGSLLIVPRVFKFPEKVRKMYTIEALILLGYVAISDHPAAIKPLIPFKVHGQVDPFNVAQFALQTFAGPIAKDRSAQLFNAGFTIVAGVLVALTDYDRKTRLP